ncbi:MAG: hypothetical protein ACXQTP_04820 [Candidatus Methanofastidiosia archaeon]
MLKIVSTNFYRDVNDNLHIIGELWNRTGEICKDIVIDCVITDSNNKEITSKKVGSMLDVLLPDEKSPFEAVFLPENVAGEASYFIWMEWEYGSKEPYRDLALSNVECSLMSDNISISGDITNNGQIPIFNIKIVLVFYDSNNVIVLAHREYVGIACINPSQSDHFSIVIPSGRVPLIQGYTIQAQGSE